MNTVSQADGFRNDIFCPIDLHEREMLIGLAIGKDRPNFWSLSTDDDGIAALLKRLHDLQSKHPGSRVWVAYEASGCGFRLADLVHEHGFEAAVLAPTNLPVTPRSRSRKTDKKDVLRILDVLRGHVLAGNDLPAVWIPSRALRDDREIVRRRLSLGEKTSKVKNTILGLLRRYGVRPPKGWSNWTKKHRRWLHSAVAELEYGAAVSLSSLLRELEFMEAETDQVEQEMIRLSSAERYSAPVQALMEIPGIGLLTAMVFLTEVGDLSRFKNRREFGSYLGLTPRCWESGEQDDRKGHISKMGPPRIRKVLNQASWSHVRWDAEAKVWYQDHTPGKKGRKKMIVATMRRLGIRMWHVAQQAA